MGLKERLLAIKTRNKADKQTIEDAVAFIDKVAFYGAKQKAVFACLGYVPRGDQSNDR